MMRNDQSTRPDRWGVTSQLFHWTCAALVIALGSIGLYMTELASPVAKIRIYALHKSLGITLLVLVILRLLWRWSQSSPAPLPGMKRHVRLAADGVHGFLYFMMIAMPLTGWLMNSASGYPLQWFRMLNLPSITSKNEALADTAGLLHEYGFYLLALLVAAHVVAALYHHLFLGDDTLRRMLPGRRRSPPPPESPP